MIYQAISCLNILSYDIRAIHLYETLLSYIQAKESWNFARNIMMYLLHDVTIKMFYS